MSSFHRFLFDQAQLSAMLVRYYDYRECRWVHYKDWRDLGLNTSLTHFMVESKVLGMK